MSHAHVVATLPGARVVVMLIIDENDDDVILFPLLFWWCGEFVHVLLPLAAHRPCLFAWSQLKQLPLQSVVEATSKSC